MKTLRYKALNLKGEKLYGIFSEQDEIQIGLALKNQGYFIVKRCPLKSDFIINKKISSKELAMLSGNFTSILKAGINLNNGLLLLANSQSNKAIKYSLLETYRSVNMGNSLWKSMEFHKKIYPNFFINMLRIGEYSGNLDLVLENLKDFYDYESKICKQIKSALLYPVILSHNLQFNIFISYVKSNAYIIRNAT